MTLRNRLTRLERSRAARHAALDAAIEAELDRILGHTSPQDEPQVWASVAESLGLSVEDLAALVAQVRSMTNTELLAVIGDQPNRG